MTELETVVQEVTVYPDRAGITRAGRLELSAGTHQIAIEGLPVMLLTESLRATGRGTARARLLSVRAERVFYTRPVAASVAELEAQLEQLRDQDTKWGNEEKNLGTFASFLAGLATSGGENLAKGLAFARADIEALQKFSAYLQSGLAETSQRLQQVQRERRELKREIARRERELEQIRSPHPLERCRAEIGVEVLQPGTLELEIQYIVPDAKWEPLYDLRVTEDEQIELVCLSQVSQKTGEDWANVSLTLSTAKPAITARLPELQPWYIGVHAPPRLMRAMAAPQEAGAPVLAALAPVLEEAAPLPEVQAMEAVTAEVRESGTALAYEVKQRANIPSDGAPHKSTVAILTLAPKLDYLTAPRIAPYTYRRAKIINDSNLVLLPGKLNIFWGTEFIGTSSLKNIAPGQEFEAFLGVDERVRVERKLIAHEVDKKLFGNRRRVQYGYRITAQNLHKQQVSLTALDQIPVSRHEEIKVQLSRTNLTPEQEGELGLLKWELALSPGEKREIEFEFTVESPREMTVVGLPE